VSSECIEKYGVYSTQTADAMAKACKEAYQADIGV
jgi:nicotinamide mononucleotide (NMN) deamidase PncC